MLSEYLLAFLAVVITGASVGCILGVRRLITWMNSEDRFLGEVFSVISWVLPASLIAINGFILPNQFFMGQGDPFVVVGSTLVAAMANLLLIGVATIIWPGRSGWDGSGASRIQAAAILILLIACLSFVGIAVGRAGRIRWDDGPDPTQIWVGIGSLAVMVIGANLNRTSGQKKLSMDDFDRPIAPDQASPIRALIVTAISIITLVYTAPSFVRLLSPWFHWDVDLPHSTRGLLMGGLTILLGLMIALPGVIVGLINVKSGKGEPPVVNQLEAVAYLMILPNLMGIVPKRLGSGNAFAGSLYASSWLTIVAAILVILFLQAIPNPVGGRIRGLILTVTVLWGVVFSLGMRL